MFSSNRFSKPWNELEEKISHQEALSSFQQIAFIAFFVLLSSKNVVVVIAVALRVLLLILLVLLLLILQLFSFLLKK